MQNFRPTWAEINLANIAHNIREFRQHIPASTRLMAVVKADGYGHGSVEVARAALSAGADWLAVALVEEGLKLRQAGIAVPILVLGYLPPEGVASAVQYHLIPGIVDEDTLQLVEQEAIRQRRKVAVHLKVDTGMGRLGRQGSQAEALALRALTSPVLDLQGVYTHFAAADEADKSFTMAQLDKFKGLVEKIEGKQILAHAGNSAAAIEVPEAHLDMVRIGISLYGLWPSSEVKRIINLKQSMSLITRIGFIKEVTPGTPISYGCTWRAGRISRIATLPIGYADGYSRLLSGKGEVLIRGQRAPLVGRVCMDYCMVDVTDLRDVAVGEEVVLYGRQGNEFISLDEVAKHIGTINYEVACGLSVRVPRYYVYRP
jgi:alanine racemase